MSAPYSRTATLDGYRLAMESRPEPPLAYVVEHAAWRGVVPSYTLATWCDAGCIWHWIDWPAGGVHRWEVVRWEKAGNRTVGTYTDGEEALRAYRAEVER
jgi:hypothetical protein